MSSKSLSEQLKVLNEPEIINDDIEIDDDATLATKVFEVNLNDEDRINNVNEFSKIRKNQIIKLSSINKRYAGKKIKRHEFMDSFENDDSDNEDIDEEEDFDDEDIEDEDIDDEDIDEENIDEEDIDDEDIDEENESDNEKNSQTSINQSYQSSIHDEKDQELNILNDYDEQTKFKAIAVKNQYKIFESLIGLRIKLQKLLTISNRLPFNNSMLNNDSNKQILDQSIKGLQKLQKIFLEIDDQMEINGKNNDCRQLSKRKGADIDDIVLSKRFCSLKEYYPSIIDEWHEKTKFAQSNLKLKRFNFFDVRPSQVIEQILSDKVRLINRTKVKRSQYKIIGDNSENTNDHYEHIYDDDDFYHTILSQIIENKLTVNQDLLLTKKFADIQRLRNKSKKVVDTKASKGRKIRYDVHEKLVNFMAPIDTTTWEEKAKDDLFKSLFGNFSIESIDE